MKTNNQVGRNQHNQDSFIMKINKCIKQNCVIRTYQPIISSFTIKKYNPLKNYLHKTMWIAKTRKHTGEREKRGRKQIIKLESKNL